MKKINILNKSVVKLVVVLFALIAGVFVVSEKSSSSVDAAYNPASHYLVHCKAIPTRLVVVKQANNLKVSLNQKRTLEYVPLTNAKRKAKALWRRGYFSKHFKANVFQVALDHKGNTWYKMDGVWVKSTSTNKPASQKHVTILHTHRETVGDKTYFLQDFLIGSQVYHYVMAVIC